MKPVLLKGTNASYFFFPDSEETILSKSKFSIVYVAAELETKRKVICKQLSPLLFDNDIAKLKFFIEASISLKHPAFVKTLDLIVEENQIFIIHEFIEGHTLQELIKDKAYYDYRYNKFFYRIIVKTLEALTYLHDKGLCHCDLKPSNIMVIDKNYSMDYDDPQIVIIDFGNMKQCFKSGNFDSTGRTYNIMYGSPEQVFGYNELVGEHSDIFSLGLILYEAIAKEAALNTSNPMFIKRIQSVVPINKHFRFDDELFYVISKASYKPDLPKSTRQYSEDEIKVQIIKSLGKRYQSAEEFRKDLAELIY